MGGDRMKIKPRTRKTPQAAQGTSDTKRGADRQLGGVDPIAHARTLAPITVEQCPVVPESFQLPDDRRGQLRTLDGDLVAEVVIALDSVAKLTPEQRGADLGDVADDASHCGAIARELVESGTVVKRLREALAFAELRHAIVASDAVVAIETVAEEVVHRARRAPAITRRYEKVIEVIDMRRAKVAAGIEAAKNAKRNQPA